jgi:hypothetical protein
MYEHEVSWWNDIGAELPNRQTKHVLMAPAKKGAPKNKFL